MFRMATVSELQATGQATENARSPSLVKVGGIMWVRVSVEEHCPFRGAVRKSKSLQCFDAKFTEEFRVLKISHRWHSYSKSIMVFFDGQCHTSQYPCCFDHACALFSWSLCCLFCCFADFCERNAQENDRRSMQLRLACLFLQQT